MRRLGSILAVIAMAAAPALASAQTAPAPVTPPPLAPGVIAPGVSIAGVPVAGLNAAAARRAVIAQHVAPRRQPLIVTFRGRNLRIDPPKVGYVADVAYAVKVALLYGRSHAVPATGVAVPLKQRVNRAKLIAVLKQRAARYSIPARNASLTLKGVKPVVRKARIGITINIAKSATTVTKAIIARDRPRYALARRRLIPSVTSAGPAVIIDRGNFRLTWWKAGKKVTFPIAVGTSDHPTPTGNFRVIQKQKNPTWFPPDSPWAAGLGPVPPGVNNPLGTRWIGTSAPAIGMHGTPQSGSIGSRASHGCIRMYVRDAERLYELVSIGTPVYIR
jgi:lipoprotein-anchoring transpeptidase ErfK/SrfK